MHPWNLPLVAAAQMREADRRAIEELGVPGLQLMETAGQRAWQVLIRRFNPPPGILVVAGKGNNGGDGLVVARLAVEHGLPVRVLLLSRPEDLRGDAAIVFRRARAAGVPVDCWPGDGEQEAGREALARGLSTSGLVVDGLLGTGLSGPPQGRYAEVIDRINAARERGARVLALDVPSGLDADRGVAFEPCIIADLTVTFGAAKVGLLMGPALGRVGELWLAEIGIPAEAMPQSVVRLVDPGHVQAVLPRARADTHKVRRGRVWIVAGSRGMTGAAVLATRGALRGGAGLVHLALPVSERPVAVPAVPEALTLPLPETAGGALSAAGLEMLKRELDRADAVVVGPGLGRDPETARLVGALLNDLAAPAVVDADALNLLAVAGTSDGTFAGVSSGPRILTPHPGEAARLLGVTSAEVQSDRPAAVRELARRSGAVVVLKGARTLIAEPNGGLRVNPTGSPALATGGTGDVLAGVIGAFCAQGMPPLEAATAGVFLHGWAGQQAARRWGVSGVVAGDLPAAVARARRDLERCRTAPDELLAACGLFSV